MNKREQGFGHVVAILAVVVVLAIGAAGWRVWDASKTTKTTNTSTTLEDPAKTLAPGMKRYSDTVGKFSVEYPENWTLKNETLDDDPQTASSTATLTSPTGTVLNLDSNGGGKGGMCEPAPGDTPFAKTNTCASWAYLSSEKTAINNIYYPSEVKNDDGSFSYAYDKTADINLVTMHFGDSISGDTYLIGLADSTPERPIKLNDPQMGFNINILFFTVYGKDGGTNYPYIYAHAKGDNEAFLSSPDAVTIKEILRTLRVNI